jgi:stearoyl-CoA desaturase (Delta-9 desaturase)
MAACDPCRLPDQEQPVVHASQKLVTVAIVAGPAVALAVIIPVLWGHAVHLSDLVIGLVFYVVTGFGITVGFHRLFTHRAFGPHRVLKIALAIMGSMAVEGSLTSWVATHRRHHMFSDHPGDPHSPHRYGPDMLRDRDIQRIDRLFPLWAAASLAIPLGIGYVLSGTLAGALTALLWAGLVRMALLHHVTWGVNSLCHTFGRRPEVTKDQSSNLWVLAVVSLGDSWHNIHHAHPSWARHGARRGMVDPSAWLIRRFEQLGWASGVRWPTAPVAVPVSVSL